jgi:hypothetical protein
MEFEALTLIVQSAVDCNSMDHLLLDAGFARLAPKPHDVGVSILTPSPAERISKGASIFADHGSCASETVNRAS